jgi:hypothetical protein
VTADRTSDAQHLRLLECWLPLAQELCASEGWDNDPRELEALVLAAAPTLAAAPGPDAARAILVVYHAMQGGRR